MMKMLTEMNLSELDRLLSDDRGISAIENWPERIYLYAGMDDEIDGFNSFGVKSLCENDESGAKVEYIRADLAVKMIYGVVKEEQTK